MHGDACINKSHSVVPYVYEPKQASGSKSERNASSDDKSRLEWLLITVTVFREVCSECWTVAIEFDRNRVTPHMMRREVTSCYY